MSFIYYQYYRFYTKLHRKFNSVDNHFEASMSIGSSLSFLIVSLTNILMLKYYCIFLGGVPSFIFASLIIWVVYWYFKKMNLGQEIVKRKPLLFNSQKISSVLVFVITIAEILISAFLMFSAKSYFTGCGDSLIDLTN